MSLYRATRNSLWRAVNRSSGRASSYGLGCCRNVSSSVLRRQESTAQLDPPNEKVQKLLEEILSLNMIEVRDLTSHLKSKLGVEDMPMGMPMMSAAAMQAPPAAQESKEESEGAEAAPVQEEKTIFNVKLESFSPDKKIAVCFFQMSATLPCSLEHIVRSACLTSLVPVMLGFLTTSLLRRYEQLPALDLESPKLLSTRLRG